MKTAIRNRSGGLAELHPRKYLFKISARMIGCRERSKIASKNSTNARTSAELVFSERKRERESKKTHLEVGPVGPRRPMGATRGQAAPAGRLGHWWPPLVSPRCLWITPGMEIF